MAESEEQNQVEVDKAIQEAVPGRSLFSRAIWLVGPCVFAAFVWWKGWDAIRDIAISVHLPFFFAMVACETGGLWLRALKWRVILGPKRHAVGLYFMAKAGGNFSPGRLGELSPLLLPSQRSARLGAWIVLDRALESLSTLCFGLFGVLFLLTRIQGATSMLLSGLILVGVLILGLGLGLLLLAKGRPFSALARRTREGSRLHGLVKLLESLQSAVIQLLPQMPVAVAMTIGATLIELTGGIFLYRSFGYSVNLAMAAAGKCANSIVGAIPLTPSPTGIPHGATGYVMHEVAGIPSDVLGTALALHFAAASILFATSFAFGIRDLRKRRNTPACDDPPENL